MVGFLVFLYHRNDTNGREKNDGRFFIVILKHKYGDEGLIEEFKEVPL